MVTHNASAQLNFVAQGYVNMDLTVSVAQWLFFFREAVVPMVRASSL